MRNDGLPDAGQDGADEEIATALRGGGDAEDDGRGDATAPPRASLSDDIAALLENGKTYVDAELAYQKARMSFVANEGKSAALLGLLALALIHLALVALVVGAVLTLAPMVGGAAATAIVVGALLLATAVALGLMRRRTREIGHAFRDETP